MSIDTKALENAVIDTLKEFIGEDVASSERIAPTPPSEMGDASIEQGDGITEQTSHLQNFSVTRPNIFPARVYSQGGKNPPIPDYPYCLVDYIRTVPDGTDLTDRFFDEEGNYVYVAHKKVILKIKFYGTSSSSSDYVANKTHMLMVVDEVRDMIDTLYAEKANTGTTIKTTARVVGKSDIIPSNFSMKDKYLETNEFNLVLATIDTIDVKADKAQYFDKIEMDTENPVNGVQGGLFLEGSDTPEQDLHVNVIAPSEQ